MVNLIKTKKPVMEIYSKGKTYKVLEVTGDEGAMMPPHLSTGEAVIMVQDGEVALEINNNINHLTKNDVFVIPPATVHSLSIKNKFKAMVVMGLDSEIEFVDN